MKTKQLTYVRIQLLSAFFFPSFFSRLRGPALIIQITSAHHMKKATQMRLIEKSKQTVDSDKDVKVWTTPACFMVQVSDKTHVGFEYLADKV